jgi:hypothetical protein
VVRRDKPGEGECDDVARSGRAETFRTIPVGTSPTRVRVAARPEATLAPQG